jgi:radical SAM superfamily enzyme YgiQ (UPF0313 family)
MSDIVLATFNARYIHTAFGLRYLLANLGPLQSRARVLEFDLQQRPVDVAEAILAEDPRILGLGVYLWNVGPTTELVSVLKQIRPKLTIVLGGPEVSHEWDRQPAVARADYLITGEADIEFRNLCAELLRGRRPPGKLLQATPPTFDQLALPYALYSDTDIANRILYVEASRGCPFRCEFCLSSLDVPVRQAPVEVFLDAMAGLIRRGARHLKFVDRTFNMNLGVSRRILEFCLEHHRPGMLFHFELIPDRLPDELRQVIRRFPPGALQFEVGIQTFNEAVAERISRRQDNDAAEANLAWLRAETGAHIHADLIAGLPGETLESFAAGFDRLVRLRPQEIQVGILKRLRGTPIGRHDEEWGMVYNPQAPYEILQNRLLDFRTVQRLKRFARVWDLTANSGNFFETMSLLLTKPPSAFAAFLDWSDWLQARNHRTDAIALTRLVDLLWEYLTGMLGWESGLVAGTLLRDYQRTGRSDVPKVLQPHVRRGGRRATPARRRVRLRQARHALLG